MAAKKQILKGAKARYELVTLLAMGGMAEIWLARQQESREMGKLVVVKRILPYLASQKKFMEMFIDEARITSRFEHPNIVQIHEVGKSGGTLFFIMEYLEGESLGFLVNTAIMTGNLLPTELTAGILAQVCDGLDYAHRLRGADGQSLNIVHRDVSPPNIVVLYSGKVKLVDFGIAKADVKLHKTITGVMKGKVSYMSPEQCRGKPLDGRSDIFSLGIIFWEVLTRRHLFKRNSEIETLQAIATAKVPSMRKFNPDVDKELDEIVLRALAKEPASRFRTAGELGTAIRKYLRGSGKRATEQEIKAFCNGLMAEHVSTKRTLLKKLEKSDISLDSLAKLKPDSDAALPEFGQGADTVETDVHARPTREVDTDDLAVKESAVDPGDEDEADEMDIPTEVLKGKRPTTDLLNLAPVDAGSEEETETVEAPVEAEDETATVESLVGLKGIEEEWGVPEVSEIVPIGAQSTVSPEVKRTPRRIGWILLVLGIVLVGVAVAAWKLWPGGEGAPESEVTKPVPPVEPTAEEKPEVVEEPKPPEPAPPPKPKLNRRPKPKPKPKPKSKPKLKEGFLRVNTDPWTVVYLGKDKLGITPLLDHKLPAGKHKITLVNEKQGIKEILSVTIKVGETASVVKRFSK